MTLANLKDFDAWIRWACETAALNTFSAILYYNAPAAWDAFSMWVM